MAGRKAGTTRYVLVFDVLGYVDADGERAEVVGRGSEFTEDELPAAAFARGIETGALVPAGSDEAAVVESDDDASDTADAEA